MPEPTLFHEITVEAVEEAELSFIDLRARFLRARGWKLTEMDDGESLVWRKVERLEADHIVQVKLASSHVAFAEESETPPRLRQ